MSAWGVTILRDLVTSVREEPGGYRVTVNETESFHLGKAEYRARPFAQGESLDWESLKQELLLSQYPAALERAVKLLAVRARSRAEIKRRLTAAGYLPDAVEMAVYKLETEALLDAAAFARTWARDRAARR